MNRDGVVLAGLSFLLVLFGICWLIPKPPSTGNIQRVKVIYPVYSSVPVPIQEDDPGTMEYVK